jgi:hypothetical protein
MRKSFMGFEVLALVPMCATGAPCDRGMPDATIIGFPWPSASFRSRTRSRSSARPRRRSSRAKTQWKTIIVALAISGTAKMRFSVSFALR